MKRATLVLAAVFCLVAICSGAQGLMPENFNYSTGQLTNFGGGANVSGGAWVNFSGTGSPIQVTAGSLT